MRNIFVNTIIESCKKRSDIFIVSGDAGLGVFDEFRKDYPDRFLNLGVAEQNMIGFSAGLSMTGNKILIYNIIPFLFYRCYEQIRNDICYQKLPVILCGIGSGLTYSPQGMTHYSIEDLGLAQTLPNLTVISPADPIEAKLAAEYALKSNNPVYVRLAKKGEPRINQKENFDISLPNVLKDGEKTALLFHGSISIEVIKAYEELVRQNIHPLLISIPVVQPINIGELLILLKNIKTVISIEEHFVNSGLGDILAKIYVEHNPLWKLKIMGIPYKFVHEIKDIDSMREHFKISANHIVNKVKSLYA